MSCRNVLFLISMVGVVSNAQAEDFNPGNFKFSGFGTFSAVKTNTDRAEFINLNTLPSGATNDGFKFDNDTLIGVQAKWAPYNDMGAVVQLLSRRNYENSFRPSVDWAYLYYSPVSSTTLRVGRFVAPALMMSDYRNVSYSNIWVRPPIDVYAQATLNNVDGVDIVYNGEVSDFSYTLQAYAGGYTLKFSGGTELEFKDMQGINGAIEYNDLTFRMSYMKSKHTSARDGIASRTFRDGWANLHSTYSNLRGLAEYLDREDRPFNVSSIGFSYDPGKFFVQGEYMKRISESVLSNGNAWQVTSGYRIAKFTPYVTYSRSKTFTKRFLAYRINPALPPVTATTTSNAKQQTVSTGLRYDFMTNVALKAQVDFVSPMATQYGETSGNGWTRVNSPRGLSSDGRIRIYTVSVDFIF